MLSRRARGNVSVLGGRGFPALDASRRNADVLGRPVARLPITMEWGSWRAPSLGGTAAVDYLRRSPTPYLAPDETPIAHDVWRPLVAARNVRATLLAPTGHDDRASVPTPIAHDGCDPAVVAFRIAESLGGLVISMTRLRSFWSVTNRTVKNSFGPNEPTPGSGRDSISSLTHEQKTRIWGVICRGRKD